MIENKKALFNYEVLEKLDAGVELLGTEVKTLRGDHGSLEGAYVTVRGGEAYLVNSEIFPFQKANAPLDFDPRRPRKLLLTKKEIALIATETETKGISAIPLKFFAKGKKIKLTIALARGKKKFDKRETIKKRESKREIDREMKRNC
ncbi:MAG TPA: SsrA-binding protein SmpB [Candidatus Paceibacterota bacterium]|nr:SsrA-binding protein SmpB [Candidatus Paceibacterota bacterium]